MATQSNEYFARELLKLIPRTFRESEISKLETALFEGLDRVRRLGPEIPDDELMAATRTLATHISRANRKETLKQRVMFRGPASFEQMMKSTCPLWPFC